MTTAGDERSKPSTAIPADIIVMKAKVDLPTACAKATVLRPQDFKVRGAAEVYADGRIVWAQPLRGVRPWTALTGSVE